MKLICAEYNAKGDMTPVTIGDNALSHNEDFYFPSFTKSLSCTPQIVLRASKLGKGFAPRFASRYYDSIGVSVRFKADTLAEQLSNDGLPETAAVAFNNSAAMSDMISYNGELMEFAMSINDKEVYQGTTASLPVSIAEFVSKASEYYMIKMGDFFFCGNLSHFEVYIDDHLVATLNGNVVLDFYIR